MNDILIYGKDKAEYDERLNKVLKALASARLKLNGDKTVIGQSHLKSDSRDDPLYRIILSRSTRGDPFTQ